MTALPATRSSPGRPRGHPSSHRAPREQWAELHDALHAEWTKLRTTPVAGWLTITVVALTAGLSAVVAAATTYPPGSAHDLAKTTLTGVDLGQAVVAVLAVVSVGNEYGTGMMATSLTAIPRRLTMLGAKAVVVITVVLAAGVVAVLGSVLAGRLLLPGNGFTPTHGYALLSLGDGPTLRAAAGSVLYLALIALLSLGIATTVRDSATAIGTVLALLYLFPVVVSAVSDPTWQRHLQQISPMDAGLAIQDTANLHGLPLSPWAGLGVLAAWAGAAMLTGALTFRIRDA